MRVGNVNQQLDVVAMQEILLEHASPEFCHCLLKSIKNKFIPGPEQKVEQEIQTISQHLRNDLARMEPSHAIRVGNLVHLGARSSSEKRGLLLNCLNQLIRFPTAKLRIMARMLGIQRTYSVHRLDCLCKCFEE